MKKLLFLIMFFVLLPSISTADDKPLVMVNTNVTDSSWSWINDEIGGFAYFRKILENNGYQVDQKFYWELNADNLAGIDIFVFSEAALILTDSDKRALRKFIRDGGAVLIMGYDDEYADPKNLESFTKDYGITFGNVDIDDATMTVINDSGIFSDDTKKVMYYGWNIYIEEGKAIPILLEEPLGTIGFAISTSKNLGNNYGKLAVSGSDEIFYTNRAFPTNLDDLDNVNFLLDIMAYLSGRPNLGVNWINTKGKGFMPGEMFTVKTRLVNKGAIVSDRSKVTVVFSDEADFAKLDDADFAVKTKMNTNIPAGENKTFEISIKVPADYSLPDAWVHVYVEDGVNPEKGLKKLKSKKISLK